MRLGGAVTMKSYRSCLLVALALAGLAAPARAQRIEIAPLTAAGYTTAGNIEKTAPGIESLKIKGGFTWGGQFDYFFGRNMGLEVSWAQQESSLTISTRSGTADLFDVKVGQLHGNFVYQWGEEQAHLRPYAFAGLGATFFSAPDLEGETKLSWSFGGGLKAFFNKTVGIKLQARYNPTSLNDESAGSFCDPFGFCSNTLSQAEFMSGLVLRF